MIKENVCLVTSEESFYSNFGAALQGYALYTGIEKFGFRCSILKYDSIKPMKDKTKKAKWNFNRIETAISRKIYNKKNKKNLQLKKKLFINFSSNINFFDEKRFNMLNIHELKNLPQILVCGSDQIWNPLFKGNKNDPIYFLQFNDVIKKRIAYAPSIGVSKLPISCKAEMAKFLNTFDSISVREKSGQDIIFNLINKKVPVIPDPTFLLTKNEWENVLVDTEERNYILLYRFVDSDIIDDFVLDFAKRNNLKIITLSMYYQKGDKKYIRKFDVGPAEFLGLVKNANFVCTESFHATVFSIIFGTPFISFGRKELKDSGDTRVLNLLNQFGLENRYYEPSNNYTDLVLLDKKDIIKATQCIDKYREIGLEYLQEALYD